MNKQKIIAIIDPHGNAIKLRWYKGFLCEGSQEQIIEKIYELVCKFSLERFVLHMYKSELINNKFYIFLGIESEKLGHIPQELITHLIIPLQKLHRCIFTEICSSFSYYDEIRSRIGLEIQSCEFTNRIPYRPKSKIIVNNPFDITIVTSKSKNHILASENIKAYVQRYEYLLYWLSTLGTGTWETFRRTCNTLQLEESNRILRRFRLLGHLETCANGSKWSSAPTTIVQIESEQSEFILCGQRNIKLINQLKLLGIVVNIADQPRGEAPPCLRLLVDNPDIITNELPLINVGKASQKLSEILPEITTWQQKLTTLELVASMQKWRKFNSDNKFEICGNPNETGMYEICDENFNHRYTLFYNQETKTWHQGDWYGLRFLSLQSQGISCQVYYDIDSKKLVVPTNQRWPEIYERALVLASGKLPTSDKSWLIYENINRELAYVLSEKLNVKLNQNDQELLNCA